MADLAVTFEPVAADLQRLREGVVAHGRAAAGGAEPQPVACFARDGATLVGGASGRLELGRLFVDDVWVEPMRRRRGLGSALIAELERAARSRGCVDALIETLLADNAALYVRLGYAPLAAIANYVPGFTRHVLLKPLRPADA